jgi:hypothetical protein
MSKTYNKLPSEILNIEDEYTSYCFDEACLFIRMNLEQGKEIKFKKEYKSFSDIYKNLDF